jgi:aerobic carbon-monoxide dehydrogenase medium subunit
LVTEYALPATPEEAAQLVAEDPAAIVMGGGTTVMPRVVTGDLNGRRVVGLARAGLDHVRRNGAMTLGAMAPLRAVAEISELPALAAAAHSIGSWALRTTATVGGNLLVDGPYGDLAPALLALDAEIGVAGANGERRVALADALQDGGALEPGELLTEVVVPATDGTTSFQRCARRAAGAPAVVTVAARVRREGDAVAEARIAVGAVGPRATRATGAEEALVGSAGDAAAINEAVATAVAATDAEDDSVASAWYRRRMTELHVRRALEAAIPKGES